MTTLNKNTNNDKRELLSKALRNYFEGNITIQWVYLVDFDDSFIYFSGEDKEYKSADYKMSYSITDVTTISFSGEPQRVERLTEYKDVVEESEVSKSLLESLIAGINKHFGGSNKETLTILKQFDDEEMVEVAPVYIAPMEIDAHNDSITLEETYNMVASINKNISSGNLKPNFDHKEVTDKFSFIKAWVAECDCEIGGHLVPEGQPLIKVKFHDKDLWEERKEGDWTGWSIGAMATSFTYVEVEDE